MPEDEEWRAFADAVLMLRDALLEPFVPILEWFIEKVGR